MAAVELSPPVFLLAMPQVQDPFFHRSVVLLLGHTEEGSFGFVVNRPTGLQLTEILQGMELPWNGDPAAEAFLGGPVQPEAGTVVFAEAPEPPADAAGTVPPPPAPDLAGGLIAADQEILPGVRLSQHQGDLETLAARPPHNFRLFLGYAGWGAGQLVSEILRNDWLTAPADRSLLFAAEPESVWERALRSVGVDPASLPAWTAPEPEGTAN
jgi:putative transcriptional regulator